jgi:hypothetical protein
MGSCVYIHSGPKSKGSTISHHLSNQARTISVTDRLRRLERLVVSLAETPQAPGFAEEDVEGKGVAHRESMRTSTSGTDSPSREVTEPLDHLSIDETETRYMLHSHWESVLEDLTEIKDVLASHQSPFRDSLVTGNSQTRHQPELLFRTQKPLSHMDILCSLPSRQICDYLVELYLRSLDIPPFGIHVPTFEKEYQSFWKDQQSASLIWLGLLHGILSMSLWYAIRTKLVMEDVPFKEHLVSLCTSRIVDCLLLSDYTRPTRYTIEVMVSYSSTACLTT